MSASGLKVEVSDNTVSRYRPLVIIADDNMTGTSGYQRAMWEMKRNNAEGKRSTAKVQGWFKEDGTLWQPNELITLIATPFGITGEERLIVDCRYSFDDQDGTVTEMTLMHRDAFDEPEEAQDKATGKDKTKGGSKKSAKDKKAKGKKSSSKKAKKSSKDNVAEFTGFVGG